MADDNLLHVLDFDHITDINNHMYEYEKLPLYNVPLDRASEDTGRCNTYGYKLINFSKNNSLFILNGKIGSDKALGKVTCNNTSLVDYLIVSSDLFPFVSEFKVIDVDPLVSDVHNRLHLTFSTMSTIYFDNKSNAKECVTKPIRWIADKKNLFVDSLENKTSIVDLLKHLDLLDVNSESYQSDLNDFVENLNCLYIKNIRNHSRSTFNRPWFNKRCHEKKSISSREAKI